MGNHGFDNEISQMWPIFMARGPAFKKGYQHPGGIEQVDIYPLICDLLKISCEKHDGDLRRVQDLLVPAPPGGGASATATASSALFAFIVLTLSTLLLQF